MGAARTVVFVHAHPDDEAIACGGAMAKAAAAGHRVVLVTATKGEHGEVAPGFLARGETLAERRVNELAEAARRLGVARVEFLGYADSGVMGTPANADPASFWRADVEEAARRLAAILDQERAEVVTVYDPNGTYGHPDHIQVHRVGVRAAELAGTAKVYESVVNRDHLEAVMRRAGPEALEGAPNLEQMDIGVPAGVVTTTVDVRDVLDVKRSAMAAHASQISETSFFLAMAPAAFEAAFGQEWFVRRGAPPGTTETDLFGGLP